MGNFVDTTGGGYQAVPASQTDKALGQRGGKSGDYLHSVICDVATAATSSVEIKDGTDVSINVLANLPGNGIGTYNIPLGIYSRVGGWSVTTAAGVSVIAVGKFT